MWTRELCKKNGSCLTSIFLIPFKILIFIFECIATGLDAKRNKKRTDYFESKKQEYERMQMLDACSYGLEEQNEEVLESIEYKTFILLIENLNLSIVQRYYKIGFNRALEILNCLEELGAIKIYADYTVEILMNENDFVKAMNERVIKNEN